MLWKKSAEEKAAEAAQLSARLSKLDSDVKMAEAIQARTDKWLEDLSKLGKTPELNVSAADQKKLAYQEASQWLRMVNLITWTLNSIFLVGAMVALNGAAQQTADVVWRYAACVAAILLCIVWRSVDNIYSVSATKARAFLCVAEADWGPASFYRTTQDNEEAKKLVARLSSRVNLPIYGVAIMAVLMLYKTALPALPDWADVLSLQKPLITEQPAVCVEKRSSESRQTTSDQSPQAREGEPSRK